MVVSERITMCIGILLALLLAACDRPIASKVDIGVSSADAARSDQTLCPGPYCDSDGDGIADVDEDTNGDGLLGCCLERCGAPASTQKGCVINGGGCGGNQRCVSGRCEPAREYACSAGELDPTRADTFGDGVADGQRDNFVCYPHDTSGTKPGRKNIQLVRDVARGWALGLEPDARYRALKIANMRKNEAAATIDFTGEQIAGFVVSTPPPYNDMKTAIAELQGHLATTVGTDGELTVRVPGTWGRSHDGFEVISGAIFDIRLGAPLTVSALREQVLASLLSREIMHFKGLPAASGDIGDRYVLRFSVVRRFAFQYDAKGELIHDQDGYPKEDVSRPSEVRLLIVGALMLRDRYQSADHGGWKADDLGNGLLLAKAKAQIAPSCDISHIAGPPQLDVIVVVDEQGGDTATGKARSARRVAHVRDMLARSIASWSLLRVCVVGASDPKGPQAALAGRCCGGRFFDVREADAIAACVADPKGAAEPQNHGLASMSAAITNALPRASKADKVRPGAHLMVLMMAHRRDAITNSALDPLGVSPQQCILDATQSSALVAALKPHDELLKGKVDPEAAASFQLIGGTCGNTCSAAISHGYELLAQRLGGFRGDECKADAGGVPQLLIDSHPGPDSPPVLTRVPLSSSLRVAYRGKVVPRSLKQGFDYRPFHNAIVQINVEVPLVPQPPPIAISYFYWR